MPAAQATGKKPNIVMIMSDDVGTWNVSAYLHGGAGGVHHRANAIPHGSLEGWYAGCKTRLAGQRSNHCRTT